MRFQCSDWTYTSMWTALAEAKRELFADFPSADSDKKMVILVTPARNNKMGMRHAQPTYLTFSAAQELQALGVLITDYQDFCYLLCQGA